MMIQVLAQRGLYLCDIATQVAHLWAQTPAVEQWPLAVYEEVGS